MNVIQRPRSPQARGLLPHEGAPAPGKVQVVQMEVTHSLDPSSGRLQATNATAATTITTTGTTGTTITNSSNKRSIAPHRAQTTVTGADAGIAKAAATTKRTSRTEDIDMPMVVAAATCTKASTKVITATVTPIPPPKHKSSKSSFSYDYYDLDDGDDDNEDYDYNASNSDTSTESDSEPSLPPPPGTPRLQSWFPSAPPTPPPTTGYHSAHHNPRHYRHQRHHSHQFSSSRSPALPPAIIQPGSNFSATVAAIKTHDPISTSSITEQSVRSKRPRSREEHREGESDGQRRSTKVRPVSFEKTMEPPILSFYGTEPVPLPSRFGALKKRLVTGHEPALEASWARLVAALRDDIRHIKQQGSALIPSIDFADIDDDEKLSPFKEGLRRYGIGVMRAVVPPDDARAWVDETKKYLQTQHNFKPPAAQDPTCFDFFWSPAQVRSRAHPNVLRAQRFAMSLWDTSDEDRLATRFPITYADRIRIESVSASGNLTVNGNAVPATPEDSLIAEAAATSSAQIAQVDNGSLERWEQDGYGRGGLYDPIFKGNWEEYNPWDPAGRINATSDLYNGAGACSMLRLYQGILALTVVEPGMIKLLPSPKLATAYFLLRPFFSPKLKAPEASDGPEAWEAYLDPANWTIDKEQSTIIHGAVPGHAQRVTGAWHPHLELESSLIAPPTLEVGDYIVWHPDQAYQFSNTNYRSNNKPPSPEQSSTPPTEGSGDGTSMLVYTPAAPLTQTNALFLSRQRKAFLRGHPAPDFDSTGTGTGSEAPLVGRPGEKEIRQVGGEEALQAMGLAPWSLGSHAVDTGSSTPRVLKPSTLHSSKSPSPGQITGLVTPTQISSSGTNTPVTDNEGPALAIREKPTPPPQSSHTKTTTLSPSPPSHSRPLTPVSHSEAEVLKMANVILFPDRYEFYMPTRASSPAPAGTPSTNSTPTPVAAPIPAPATAAR